MTERNETPTQNAFSSLIPLVVLVVVIVFLIKPYKWIVIKRSRDCKKGLKIWIDYGSVPILAVIALFLSRTISFADVKYALIGDENSRPWTILILFFAPIYTYRSLDITGAFDWISIWTLRATSGDGKKVWATIVLLSSLMTMVTSNDVVVLTITPIACAFSTFAQARTGSPSLKFKNYEKLRCGVKVNPLPFVVSAFFVANVWSMLLVIGNPTNIIVADAYNIQFLEYSAWMTLPTLVSAFSCTILLYLRFRSEIPTVIKLPDDLNEAEFLTDPKGAIFGAFCASTSLVLLTISSFIYTPLWAIALIFALLMFIKDIIRDIHAFCTGTLTLRCFKSKKPVIEDIPLLDLSPPTYGSHSTQTRLNATDSVGPSDDAPVVTEEPSLDYSKATEESSVSLDNSKASFKKQRSNSALQQVCTSIPWKAGIFLSCLFIIVQALHVSGWTALAATGLVWLITLTNSEISIVSTFVVGFVSILMCGTLNNQPATVLLAKVFNEPVFQVSPLALKGALYSLIIGSNLGGNATKIGALAGIVWSSILASRQYKITFLQFLAYGLVIMPLVAILTLGVLCAELVVYGLWVSV